MKPGPAPALARSAGRHASSEAYLFSAGAAGAAGSRGARCRASGGRWTGLARAAARQRARVGNAYAVAQVKAGVALDDTRPVHALRGAVLRHGALGALGAAGADVVIGDACVTAAVVPGQALKIALCSVAGGLRGARRNRARIARGPASVDALIRDAAVTTGMGAFRTGAFAGFGAVDARAEAQLLAPCARRAAANAITGGDTVGGNVTR